MYKRPMIVRFFNHRRGSLKWISSTLVPSFAALLTLGVMIIVTLITIGEDKSGPAANLSPSSTCHTHLLCDTHSFGPGPDLCTQASRVDQAQLDALAVTP